MGGGGGGQGGGYLKIFFFFIKPLMRVNSSLIKTSIQPFNWMSNWTPQSNRLSESNRLSQQNQFPIVLSKPNVFMQTKCPHQSGWDIWLDNRFPKQLVLTLGLTIGFDIRLYNWFRHSVRQLISKTIGFRHSFRQLV